MMADELHRRAGGRRRYNATRRALVFWRLLELEHILRCEGYQVGDYARLSKRLGVSRATVCRDVRRLWGASGSALIWLGK